MIRAISFCLALVASSAVAGAHVAHLSKFDSRLKLVSFNQSSSTAVFRGELPLRGTIYFEFDQTEPGKNVEVNFAKFVPDRAGQALLPTVC